MTRIPCAAPECQWRRCPACAREANRLRVAASRAKERAARPPKPCAKCGSPRTRTNAGRNVCRPCEQAYQIAYQRLHPRRVHKAATPKPVIAKPAEPRKAMVAYDPIDAVCGPVRNGAQGEIDNVWMRALALKIEAIRADRPNRTFHKGPPMRPSEQRARA